MVATLLVETAQAARLVREVHQHAIRRSLQPLPRRVHNLTILIKLQVQVLISCAWELMERRPLKQRHIEMFRRHAILSRDYPLLVDLVEECQVVQRLPALEALPLALLSITEEVCNAS